MTPLLVELKKALRKLPAPVARFTTKTANLEVYRAKDLHTRAWNSPALKKVMVFARSSYSRYGKRPLFDAYDAKAAIYAVRAIYSNKGNKGRVEEWLSVRMVPGDGLPWGVGEPEIFTARNKPVDTQMKEKLGGSGFWKKVASSSRMCGIHPYAVDDSGEVRFLQETRHKETPLSFALIHKQFISDYPIARFPYKYITAVIRKDFYVNRLKYSTLGKKYYPLFTPAYSFLKLQPNEVRVERKKYSYDFPTYWFDNKKLLNLLNRLRKLNKLSLLRVLIPAMIPKLSGSNKQIEVAGVRLKLHDFHALLDRYVPDGPELKITKAAPWYRSMSAILNIAKKRTQKRS